MAPTNEFHWKLNLIRSPPIVPALPYSYFLCRKLMREEAANEAIAMPFEGCIKHVECRIFPPALHFFMTKMWEM